MNTLRFCRHASELEIGCCSDVVFPMYHQRTSRGKWPANDFDRLSGDETLLLLDNTAQSLIKCRDGPFNILQFVQPEQANAECLKLLALITHQGHSGRNLQSGLSKLLSTFELRVCGIADNHRRRRESIRCDARQAVGNE